MILRPGYRDILRDADGEGGGGAEGGATASGNDTVKALMARLDKMGKQVEDLTREGQQSKLRTDVQRYESDLNRKLAETTAGVDTAESKLAAALDEGDGPTIAKAQRNLAEAVAEREKAGAAVDNFKARLKEAERRAKEEPRNTGNDGDPTNLNNWKNKHADWYGVDKDMTKAAHEIDAEIRGAGVIPVGSQEYFNAIDRQMRQRFPDRLSGAPSTERGGGSGAPVTGSRGRIPQSIVDGWRRMGINTEDPKTIERMLAHRQTAVEKGILPQEMIRDRVISR